MKKILTIIMCLCLAFSMTTMTTFASVGDELSIQPLAANYNAANAYLSIAGGDATCQTVVSGIVGKTTKIMVRMYLQEYSGNTWKTIDNWSLTKNSSTLSLEKTASVAKGSKYRVKADITAYVGVERESITKYSSVVSY